MSKIPSEEIRPKIQRLIGEAEIVEPALAKRLKEIDRWIKDMPPGLLTRKKVLLNFLTEIIVDAELWLGFYEQSLEEQKIGINNLSAVEKFWYFTLFPLWLNEQDPKLDKWKQEILKDSCRRDDAAQINQLRRSVRFCGGHAHKNMILDFSMATDLMVSGYLEQALCVQLTISAQQHTCEKIRLWKKTLKYWKMERALFISFDPCGQYRDSRVLAQLLIDKSNSLPRYGCQETYFV